MSKNNLFIVSVMVVSGLVFQSLVTAQRQGGTQQAKPRTPPPSPQAAAAGDVQSVLFNWMWYMGMLRGVDEVDRVATIDIRKGTGTLQVDGQPCKLTEYRASINYQMPGMRVQYTCTRPNGQTTKAIEVVSGQFAWDEDQMGAGLVAGHGTATPKPAALNERLIRLWTGPQGAPKAAAMAGANTKVAVEAGKAVVTFPIPGVAGATAKATLNADNRAERLEVRQGAKVTEFIYSKYADLNTPGNKVEGFFAGSVVEKQDGMTVRDIAIGETEVGNPYVIMPVPQSVQRASTAH